jgi:hypothetical protein
MVDSPRYMSYVRMDKWDEEATKWFENKVVKRIKPSPKSSAISANFLIV